MGRELIVPSPTAPPLSVELENDDACKVVGRPMVEGEGLKGTQKVLHPDS